MMFSTKSFAAATAAFALIASSTAEYDPNGKGNTVVYWGSGSNQERLSYYCYDDSIDIIPIAFINSFPAQADGLVGEAYASNACWAGPVYQGPGYPVGTKPNTTNDVLLRDCPYLQQDLWECQQNTNTKFLISLGGDATTGNYQLNTPEDGVYLANFLWGAYGPYQQIWADAGGVRPLDGGWDGNDASMKIDIDGFDFDIEKASPNEQAGYIACINRLHVLFDTYKAENPCCKDYLITGAPQCPRPDENMSNMINQAKFDIIWPQFYNNGPAGCTAREWVNGGAGFNFADWASDLLAGESKDAKLYLGLLGGASGSPGSPGDYLTPTEAKKLIAAFESSIAFGGVMLWDAVSSFDPADSLTSYQFANGTSVPSGAAYYDVIKNYLEVYATSYTSTPSVCSNLSAAASSSSRAPGSYPTSSSNSSGAASSSSRVLGYYPSSSSNSLAAASSSSRVPGSYPSSSSNSSATASSSSRLPGYYPTSSSNSLAAASSSSKLPGYYPSSSSNSSAVASSSSRAPGSYPTSSSNSSGAASSSSRVPGSYPSSSSNSSAAASSSSVSSIPGSYPSSTSSSLAAASSSSLPGSYPSSNSSGSAAASSSSSVSSLPGYYTSSTLSFNSSSSSSATATSSSSVSSLPGSYPSSSSSPSSVNSFPISSASLSTGTGSGAAATTSSSISYTTSTVSTTTVYTITSCAAAVTDCPAKIGSVTTDTIVLYTTICPVTATETNGGIPTSTAVASFSPVEYTTSTVYATTTYTITSCAPTVTNCPAKLGQVTTDIISLYVTVCPVSEAEATATPNAENTYSTTTLSSTTTQFVTVKVVQSPAALAPYPISLTTQAKTLGTGTGLPVLNLITTTAAGVATPSQFEGAASISGSSIGVMIAVILGAVVFIM